MTLPSVSSDFSSRLDQIDGRESSLLGVIFLSSSVVRGFRGKLWMLVLGWGNGLIT